MLVSLRIENFALVDHLELTFGPGLNVLTGETGAGKSIILDAVDCVLGGKLNSRMIRGGTCRTVIEATFQLTEPLRRWLATADIDPLEEAGLVCSRELSDAQGTLRSRSRVNGVLVNKAQMESLREHLVEITAQGQTLQLGKSALQRDWLDAFGEPSLLTQRQTVAHCYSAYQTAQHRLDDHRQNEQQRLQQLDILTYQLEELQDANLGDPAEQTHLIQEFQRLSHGVELQQQSYIAYQLLYDHPQGVACTDLLGQAVTILRDMSAVDPQTTVILELVQGALAQVQEAGTQIRRYGDALETDPLSLEDLQARLQQLKQICRKYGPTLSDVIAHQTLIQQELQTLTGDGVSLAQLEENYATATTALTQACTQLTHLRQRAAADLEARLVAALKPLAMDKVQFAVTLTPMAPTVHGADRVTFVFSPNPGEPLQPLSDTASGGEMSRFLLALKACFSQIDPVATFVFDEVDTGVSGRIAQAIAEMLHRLSQNHQILCVTHQPIIAAMADHHFHVEKRVIAAETEANGAPAEVTAERTVVRIHPLAEQQRPLALAQLAGGGTTEQMLAFANSLLQQAAQMRYAANGSPSATKMPRTRRKSTPQASSS